MGREGRVNGLFGTRMKGEPGGRYPWCAYRVKKEGRKRREKEGRRRKKRKRRRRGKARKRYR